MVVNSTGPGPRFKQWVPAHESSAPMSTAFFGGRLGERARGGATLMSWSLLQGEVSADPQI